jgi:CheY-like chemotaxis protein
MSNQQLRILCVEDDDIVRLNAVEALKDAGFDVLEAEDGDRAMALMEEPDSVDIVFTDVAMPGQFDGVDLVEKIRLTHPAMPVLVTSAYALHLSNRLRKLSPPTVFIIKPYSFSHIIEVLEKLAIRSD